MSRRSSFTVQASNEIVTLRICSPASSIPFPDVREEFVNSRDAAVSFIWYAIFAGGSSCYHGAVAAGKGWVSWKQGSKLLLLLRSLAISLF